MKYTIKNAKDLDPYTPIMALSNGGCANHYLAGEIGEGPCVLLRDIENVLQNAEPRTDEEVFEYIADEKLNLMWIDSLVDTARKLVILSENGIELYASSYEFPVDVSLSCMLRDGINYILDMEDAHNVF